MQIIISDSTALIILAKTDKLFLLSNLFAKIYIPEAVFDEVNFKNDIVKDRLNQTKFIEVKKITDRTIFDKISAYNIDKGEIEAITLAIELNENLLIDERKGRIVAKENGVLIIGLLGILRNNYKLNFINLDELKNIFNEFKDKKLRISNRLEKIFLESL